MLEISKAVIEKNGKFLLLKRGLNSKSFQGQWDFPGGKLNAGENPIQAIIREVREETSYEINPGDEVKKENYCCEKHNLLVHYFVPIAVFGELKLNSEHSDFAWVAKEKMKNFKVHPCIKLFFDF